MMTNTPSCEQNLERTISDHEDSLGLDTDAKRLAVASLFIDACFLKSAVIMGKPLQPERLFGHAEWCGFVGARALAQEHLGAPLDVPFIRRLHTEFLTPTRPELAGQFRNNDGGRGGQFVNGEFLPVRYTEAQIAVINENRWLRFEPASPDDTELGFIHYTAMDPTRVEEELEGICEQYNDKQAYVGRDSFELAAWLQQEIVSLHPTSGGIDGRLSYGLMNWSLESNKEYPSAIHDPHDDLLSTRETWRNSVAEGSARYGGYQKRIGQGLETFPQILGLEDAQRLYDEGSWDVPVMEYGSQHPRTLYGTFIEQFEHSP